MPRPINTTKTYGATGNKFGHNDQDAIERFWRHLLAGAASMRFHRPTAGLGLNEKAIAVIRAARKLESKIPLWSVESANHLLSHRKPNEAYLAADPGQVYAIYFPSRGRVKINMEAAKESLVVHWIDIDSGEWGPIQKLRAKKRITLKSPGKGNWAAAIVVSK